MRKRYSHNQGALLGPGLRVALALSLALFTGGCLSLPGAVTVRPAGLLLDASPLDYEILDTPPSTSYSRPFECFGYLTFPGAFPRDMAYRFSEGHVDKRAYVTDVECYSDLRIIYVYFWAWIFPEYRFEYRVCRRRQ